MMPHRGVHGRHCVVQSLSGDELDGGDEYKRRGGWRPIFLSPPCLRGLAAALGNHRRDDLGGAVGNGVAPSMAASNLRPGCISNSRFLEFPGAGGEAMALLVILAQNCSAPAVAD